MQEILSSTGAIAVMTLTSSSQHIMHVRQLSYWCMKLRSSSVWTCVTPNRPDLNPANYRIWGMMQDPVYQTPIQDMANLRQCLIDTWSYFLQSIVDDAIDECHKRLQALVNEQESHFEHLL